MFSNSCFGVGRVRLNCGLPGGLLGRVNLDGLHLCYSLSSFFAFAGCPKFSPRFADANDTVKLSVNSCPSDGGIIFNLGMTFWSLVRCRV